LIAFEADKLQLIVTIVYNSRSLTSWTRFIPSKWLHGDDGGLLLAYIDVALAYPVSIGLRQSVYRQINQVVMTGLLKFEIHKMRPA